MNRGMPHWLIALQPGAISFRANSPVDVDKCQGKCNPICNGSFHGMLDAVVSIHRNMSLLLSRFRVCTMSFARTELCQLSCSAPYCGGGDLVTLLLWPALEPEARLCRSVRQGGGVGSPPLQGLAAAGPGGGSDGVLLDHPNRVRSVNRDPLTRDPLTRPGAFAAGAPRQRSAGNRIVTQGAANLGAWRHDDGPVRRLASLTASSLRQVLARRQRRRNHGA
jgi:hypothetical protein